MDSWADKLKKYESWIWLAILSLWFLFSLSYYYGLLLNIPDGFKIISIFDVIYNFKLWPSLIVMVLCCVFLTTYAKDKRDTNSLFVLYLVVNLCAIAYLLTLHFYPAFKIYLFKAIYNSGMKYLYVLDFVKIVFYSTLWVITYLYFLLKLQKHNLTELLFAVLFSTFIISYLCFNSGVLYFNAQITNNDKAKTYIYFQDGEKINADLIESFEKGVLIKEPNHEYIRFISWSSIKSIDFYYSNINAEFY